MSNYTDARAVLATISGGVLEVHEMVKQGEHVTTVGALLVLNGLVTAQVLATLAVVDALSGRQEPIGATGPIDTAWVTTTGGNG